MNKQDVEYIKIQSKLLVPAAAIIITTILAAKMNSIINI